MFISEKPNFISKFFVTDHIWCLTSKTILEHGQTNLEKRTKSGEGSTNLGFYYVNNKKGLDYSQSKLFKNKNKNSNQPKLQNSYFSFCDFQ